MKGINKKIHSGGLSTSSLATKKTEKCEKLMPDAGFNFDSFYSSSLVLSHFKNRELPKKDFLIWLIGFVEGDGCFLVTARKDIHFIITQGDDNIAILNEIQEVLGIGRVIKQGKRTSRLIIENK
jgi:hypothetical protein